MISFTKLLNLFILILLIASFNEVTSAVIKRDGQSNFCTGFKITNPDKHIELKNGTSITVTWEKGGSKIDTISDLELFTDSGSWNTLWEGTKHFDSDGKAKLDNVVVFASSSLKLPAEVMIRSWGSTSSGPNCFVFTPKFTLTE